MSYFAFSIALFISAILWLILVCYFLSTSAVVNLFYVFSSLLFNYYIEQSYKFSGFLK